MVAARQDLATAAIVMPGDANKDRHLIYMQAIQHCGLDLEKIENVRPCTPFQRDVMDCAAGNGRRAVGHVVYEIPEDVNIERLSRSLEGGSASDPGPADSCVRVRRRRVFSVCAVGRLRMEVRDKFG